MTAALPPEAKLSPFDPPSALATIASLPVNYHAPVPVSPSTRPPLDLREPVPLSALAQENRWHEPSAPSPSLHSRREPPGHIHGSSLTLRSEVPLPAPFGAASFCRGEKSRYPELIPPRH